jgi:hypothetical protein
MRLFSNLGDRTAAGSLEWVILWQGITGRREAWASVS